MSYSSYKNLGNKTDEGINKEIMEKLVPRLTSTTDKMRVLTTHKIVVIDIYADWCQPCKAIAPRIAELSRKYSYPSLCAFAKENLDDKISNNEDITGVPTFQFYVGGKMIKSIVGADVPEIEKQLVSLLDGFRQ